MRHNSSSAHRRCAGSKLSSCCSRDSVGLETMHLHSHVVPSSDSRETANASPGVPESGIVLPVRKSLIGGCTIWGANLILEASSHCTALDSLAPRQRGEGQGEGNLLSPTLSSTSLWRRGRDSSCTKTDLRPTICRDALGDGASVRTGSCTETKLNKGATTDDSDGTSRRPRRAMAGRRIRGF